MLIRQNANPNGEVTHTATICRIPSTKDYPIRKPDRARPPNATKSHSGSGPNPSPHRSHKPHLDDDRRTTQHRPSSDNTGHSDTAPHQPTSSYTARTSLEPTSPPNHPNPRSTKPITNITTRSPPAPPTTTNTITSNINRTNPPTASVMTAGHDSSADFPSRRQVISQTDSLHTYSTGLQPRESPLRAPPTS
jgi:hypothetical protein